MYIVSTDAAILCKVEIINDIIMNEQFNELVISGDTLKFLKVYKYQRVNIIVFQDNDEYVMQVNDDKYYIDVIDNEYPNISGIKLPDSDNNYTISLSQDVIEKISKVMKASNSRVVTITFNTSSNLKPFKCFMTNYDDVNVDVIAMPCRE